MKNLHKVGRKVVQAVWGMKVSLARQVSRTGRAWSWRGEEPGASGETGKYRQRTELLVTWVWSIIRRKDNEIPATSGVAGVPGEGEPGVQKRSTGYFFLEKTEQGQVDRV
jgi:hypothetical protein